MPKSGRYSCIHNTVSMSTIYLSYCTLSNLRTVGISWLCCTLEAQRAKPGAFRRRQSASWWWKYILNARLRGKTIHHERALYSHFLFIAHISINFQEKLSHFQNMFYHLWNIDYRPRMSMHFEKQMHQIEHSVILILLALL